MNNKASSLLVRIDQDNKVRCGRGTLVIEAPAGMHFRILYEAECATRPDLVGQIDVSEDGAGVPYSSRVMVCADGYSVGYRACGGAWKHLGYVPGSLSASTDKGPALEIFSAGGDARRSVTVAFDREDGDLTVLACLNNNEELLTAAEFQGLIDLVVKYLGTVDSEMHLAGCSPHGGDAECVLNVLERVDCPDFLQTDENGDIQ